MSLVNTIVDHPNWETHDRIFSEEYMYTLVESAACSKGLKQTSRALPLMKQLHAGQYRRGREHIPYINHPLMMACHAMALGIDEDSILAATLLHDVCEDCDIIPEKLPVEEETREAVRLLTFRIDPGETKAAAKSRYFSDIAENRIALFVKLLDRCNNVSMMATGFPRQKMIRYIKETDQYLIPQIGKLHDNYPEFHNAAFLLKYQLLSMLETLKRTLI